MDFNTNNLDFDDDDEIEKELAKRLKKTQRPPSSQATSNSSTSSSDAIVFSKNKEEQHLAELMTKGCYDHEKRVFSLAISGSTNAPPSKPVSSHLSPLHSSSLHFDCSLLESTHRPPTHTNFTRLQLFLPRLNFGPSLTRRRSTFPRISFPSRNQILFTIRRIMCA